MITNALTMLLICIFAFVPLLLGEFARNRSNNTINDFVLQERNMGIVPLFSTIFSTWMSVFAFVGSIGYFYNNGPIYLTSIAWDALFAVLFILVGKRIWYYGKQRGYMTPVDFFDDIYGSRVLNNLVITITIVCTLIYIQAQLVGGILIIDIVTGGKSNLYVATMVFFAIIVVYLWAGGIRAVSYADLFYGILIVVAILASGFYIINLAGGPDQAFHDLLLKNPSNVSLTGENSEANTAMWVCLFIVVPVGAFMGPQIWIRNYVSSNEENFNILPFLICLSSIVCLGTLLAGSGCAAMFDDIENAESLLVGVIKETANPYFYVLILVGIFASIFSTANSQLHALSAVYTLDIHRRYINRKEPDQNLLRIARYSILVISAISYLLVILIPQSVFDLAVIALGGTAQLIVPVIGGLYWKRSTAVGAIVGLTSGELVYLLSISFDQGEASYYAVLSLCINISCFISASLTDGYKIKTANKIIMFKNEYETRND